jgi:hypothetical protein
MFQASRACGSAGKGFEDPHGIGLCCITKGVRKAPPVVSFALDKDSDAKLLGVVGIPFEFTA